jgi:hypothetical protein
LPDHFIEPSQSAVKVVEAIVGSQCVLYAVECEFASCYSAGDSTYSGTKVRVPSKVTHETIESEHNIAKPTVPVRHMQLCNNGTIRDNLCSHSTRVSQNIKLHWLTIWGLAKAQFLQSSPIV